MSSPTAIDWIALILAVTMPAVVIYLHTICKLLEARNKILEEILAAQSRR